MNWNEIKIKTPHLQTGEVNLHFYQSTSKNAAVSLKTKRIISIFGRNGSGKTTISNAFLDMKKTEFQNSNLILSSQLFLKTKDNSHIIDTAITLSPDDKQQLFVYNEQFVDQHIKISKDKNLKAIIMLSDNPDLTNKLEKLKKQEKAILKQQEQANNNYQTFETNDYEYNDKLIKQEIESKLKAAGHWADLGQQIRGLDVKQRLDHKAFTKIQNIDISGGTPEIADKLKSLLSQNITKLTEIRESTELPLFTEPTADQNPFPKALELLNESIKEPDLHDLEARVMKVFSKKGQTQIDNDRNLFVAPDTDYCPTCFRKLNRSEKTEIVSAIDQVLIQAHTADFKNKLSSIHFFKYGFLNSLLYKAKFPEKVAHYNQAVTDYNEMVDAFEKAIATKLDNVFSTPELPAFNNKQLFAEMKKQAHLINKDVQSYNAIFSNQSALTSSAELINMHLAKYDCRQDFHCYEFALKRRSILKQACLQAKNELKKTNQQITTLKATMAHQKIALDQINTMLAHIFMDKNRLSLVEGNNCYRVRSRKEFIPLSQLSVGERNAIGLCYFFSRINANRRVEQAFHQECTIILDDPISSFDFENKIGILSLLRENLDAILLSNNESKVILMTHDLEMFRHFSKIFDDIEEKRKLLEKKHKTKIKKIAYDNLQLENGRLSLLPTKSYNDYAAQLRRVYQFATNHQNEKGTSSNTQSDLYIGNVMRRVIESFATFCYQMGTSSIFNDSDILEQLPTSHQKLFGSFMYRLVFNSESHGKESVKSRGDSYYIELISHPELQKTAQMLIIFMNDLNSLHLQKNIPDFSLETVHTWEDLII